MLAFGTKPVLLLLPLTVKEPTAVWASPIVKAIAPVLFPSVTVCAAMSDIVGAVFAFTVNTKVSLALSEPSLTVTVMVAVPL
jgi:hypothetical protein